MRGKKAKAIRKKIYGKGGKGEVRRYDAKVKVFEKKKDEAEARTNTTIVNKPYSLRALYQAAKRDLYANR